MPMIANRTVGMPIAIRLLAALKTYFWMRWVVLTKLTYRSDNIGVMAEMALVSEGVMTPATFLFL